MVNILCKKIVAHKNFVKKKTKKKNKVIIMNTYNKKA